MYENGCVTFSSGLEVPRVRLIANFSPNAAFPGIFYNHVPVAIFEAILPWAYSINFLFLHVP
jgi:hypothetical protein